MNQKEIQFQLQHIFTPACFPLQLLPDMSGSCRQICRQLQQVHSSVCSALRTALTSAYGKADSRRKAAQSPHSTAIATQRVRGCLTRDNKRSPTAAGYERAAAPCPHRAGQRAGETPTGISGAAGTEGRPPRSPSRPPRGPLPAPAAPAGAARARGGPAPPGARRRRSPAARWNRSSPCSWPRGGEDAAGRSVQREAVRTLQPSASRRGRAGQVLRVRRPESRRPGLTEAARGLRPPPLEGDLRSARVGGGGRVVVGRRAAVVQSLPVALLRERRAEREQARAARGAAVPLLSPNQPTPGQIWF